MISFHHDIPPSVIAGLTRNLMVFRRRLRVEPAMTVGGSVCNDFISCVFRRAM